MKWNEKKYESNSVHNCKNEGVEGRWCVVVEGKDGRMEDLVAKQKSRDALGGQVGYVTQPATHILQRARCGDVEHEKNARR